MKQFALGLTRQTDNDETTVEEVLASVIKEVVEGYPVEFAVAVRDPETSEPFVTYAKRFVLIKDRRIIIARQATDDEWEANYSPDGPLIDVSELGRV